MSSECLMYGLDLESRCIVPVRGEEEKIQFLIGSQNIKLDNQVCLLSVEGDWQRVVSRSFPHPIGEVRGIASSPEDAELFATVSADYRLTSPLHRINLWRIDEDKLEECAEMTLENPVHSLEWDQQSILMAYYSNGHLCLVSPDSDSLKPTFNQSIDGRLHSLTFSPHENGNVLGLCVDKDVLLIDQRTPDLVSHIRETHAYRCLTMDFNPNLQYLMATGGDDGTIRVWDTRKGDVPVYATRPHAHWIWKVSYHPIHDQLLLSCSSDACVVLSSLQSVSSEATLPSYTNIEDVEEEDEEDTVPPLLDGQLECVDEHEESVYSCVWSSSDPWSYASLSHDGRVVVNRVQRQHKYALMQLS